MSGGARQGMSIRSAPISSYRARDAAPSWLYTQLLVISMVDLSRPAAAAVSCNSADREALRSAAAKSNEVLAELGTDIQWEHSYVTGNKVFCVYLATGEGIIQKHAELSGFPATKVTPVSKMIDPTTEKAE